MNTIKIIKCHQISWTKVRDIKGKSNFCQWLFTQKSFPDSKYCSHLKVMMLTRITTVTFFFDGGAIPT